MEYDERVIIKFLLNERADAREIADIFQIDCRHSLVNIFINFERFNSRLQRYGSVVKTSMMKFAPEDLLWMILMPKFWLYWTNLLLNQLA
jgi:hypothetical protein